MPRATASTSTGSPVGSATRGHASAFYRPCPAARAHPSDIANTAGWGLPPVPPLPAATACIDNIDERERQLVTLKVTHRSDPRPTVAATAAGIIAELNTLRQTLAEDVRDALWVRLGATTPPEQPLRIAPDASDDALRFYLRYAGLDMLRKVSPTDALAPAQRTALGECLREAGCRTGYLRDWLQLDYGQRDEKQARKLLDLMLPQWRAEELRRTRAALAPPPASVDEYARRDAALSALQRRIHLRADTVGRRFGYVHPPATSFMPGHTLDRRLVELKEVGKWYRTRRWGDGIVMP